MSKEEMILILALITLIISVILLITNYILMNNYCDIQEAFINDIKKALHHVN